MRRWLLLLPIVLGFVMLTGVMVAAQGLAGQPASHTQPASSPLESAALAADIPITAPILSEGFEGMALATTWEPDVWFTKCISCTEESLLWRIASSRAYSGTDSVFYDDYDGWQDAWLVTPQITPTGVSELVFWQYENYDSYYYKHSIWVSTGASGDPKDADSDYAELTELGAGAEDAWEEKRVDLSDYAGQSIYLAFRYQGDDADEWYIDEVQVTAGLYAINDGPTVLSQTTTLTAIVPPGRGVITYTWDFDDGELGSGSVVTHVYPAVGIYTAVVTATNDSSLVTATTKVDVRESLYGNVYLPLVLAS